MRCSENRIIGGSTLYVLVLQPAGRWRWSGGVRGGLAGGLAGCLVGVDVSVKLGIGRIHIASLTIPLCDCLAVSVAGLEVETRRWSKLEIVTQLHGVVLVWCGGALGGQVSVEGVKLSPSELRGLGTSFR